MQVWPQLYDELKSLPSKDNISAFDNPPSDDVIVKSPLLIFFTCMVWPIHGHGLLTEVSVYALRLNLTGPLYVNTNKS